MPSTCADDRQGGGQKEKIWFVWGGGRHAGGLAGWSAEVLSVWGVPQACGCIYIYILVSLLFQPVRSRAILDTCAGGHL